MTWLSKNAASNIATLLIEYQIVDEQQVKSAVAASDESGRGLVDTLIDFAYVSEDKILDVLADTYGLEKMNFNSEEDLRPIALSQLPEKFIIENRIYPFEKSDGVVKVAIADPTSLGMIGNVKVITGQKVSTYITTFSELQKRLENLTEKAVPANSKVKLMASSKKPNVNPKGERLKVEKEDANQSPEPKDINSSEVILFVNNIIAEAIRSHTSDIHIEPYKDRCRLRYRLDGVLKWMQKEEKFLTDRFAAVTTRIKIMAGLDIAERRLPQDGAITFKVDNRDVDIRTSVLPTAFGERVVMRILDRGSISLSIDSLGFDVDGLEKFKKAIDSPQGLILVTGPTGSGKSTTLYAALNRVNCEGINILTAEDPVEYNVEGIGQVQVKDDIGFTFSSALRSFLRQDPEVILVGEIRDKETCDIAIKSALTGHLVLSTLHTNDAVSTITRLINMGVPTYLITAALSLVVAQRLARRNCSECKMVDDSNSESDLISLQFTAQEASRVQVYKGKGCKNCNGTGYKGRQAIYEVLHVTETIKESILKGNSTPEIRDVALNEGFSTMQAVARGFLQEGTISVEEYRRILILE